MTETMTPAADQVPKPLHDPAWRISAKMSHSLPPMAWVLRVQAPIATVVIGRQVTAWPDGVFEGSWAGAAGSRGVLESTTTFGSGVLVDGRHLRLVPPSHHLESIYVHRRRDGLFASNSLVGLLKAADLQLEPGVDYPEVFSHAGDGTFRFTIPTRGGEIIAVLYEGLSVATNGSIADTVKRREEPFTSFQDYRARLTAAFASVVANAPGYEIVPTMSSGYDSASMAVIAREAGARRAVTIAEGKPVRGTSTNSDSGEATARALGLSATTYDRLAYQRRTDLPEAEFLATGMSGEDVVFSAMADELARTILVTGFFGDGMWWSNRPPRPLFWRLEQAGLSFTEFRLRVGFIHVPLPWFGATEMRSVETITASAEMKPWVLGMDNDRPIPRRILEEAGVRRGTFAAAKRATSAALHAEGPAAMAPASVESLAEFARRHGDRVEFRPRRFPRWRRRAYSRARRLKLRRIAEWLEVPRRLAVRHPPEFGNLLLRWAVDVIGPRYAAVADELRHE